MGLIPDAGRFHTLCGNWTHNVLCGQPVPESLCSQRERPLKANYRAALFNGVEFWFQPLPTATAEKPARQGRPSTPKINIFLKINWPWVEGFISGFPIQSYWYICLSMQVPCCLDYCGFGIVLTSEGEVFQLVLLFRLVVLRKKCLLTSLALLKLSYLYFYYWL